MPDYRMRPDPERPGQYIIERDYRLSKETLQSVGMGMNYIYLFGLALPGLMAIYAFITNPAEFIGLVKYTPQVINSEIVRPVEVIINYWTKPDER